jgi:hypothetical protein
MNPRFSSFSADIGDLLVSLRVSDKRLLLDFYLRLSLISMPLCRQCLRVGPAHRSGLPLKPAA